MDLNVIKSATEGLIGGVGNIIGKLKADPTKIAELEIEAKKMVLEHGEKMEELVQQEYSTRVRDLESARNREVGLKNTIGVFVQNVSAIVVIVAFVGLLYVSFFYDGQVGNRGIVDIMIGSLGTIVVNIFGYWFGSSQGSANKENQIKEILKNGKI